MNYRRVRNKYTENWLTTTAIRHARENFTLHRPHLPATNKQQFIIQTDITKLY